MLRTLVCAFSLTLALAGAVILPAGPSLAGPVSITEADPVATVTIPDDWTHSKITRGAEIKSPDEEVYVWFELVAPGEIEAVQKEHEAYFTKEGVTITSASDTVKQEVDGRAWSFTELKAKTEDGASIIRYIAINPNAASGKIVMLTYWASEDGHKEHDAAMGKIVKGIAFK
ncbi:hypothetical protein DWF00_27000 [Bosea caraganae]|uniref:Histidine kinase n=1 Tax=Bosea caraganae TaxID=2763117 RepID=A0A370L9J7_9HYPH|nr:hypothetical protein [Bosea caraganae]RDJ21972.1 hypothetical protein DWF00_27000 [Bosea caraganae]RDJ27995.1 hypothetical protein DWE98_05155 [Bosea caraganae]